MQASASLPLALVVGSLECGGAERALVALAHSLAARGHRVTVITFRSSESDFFTLGSGVERIALGFEPDRGNILCSAAANLRRVVALRRAVREARPVAVVSFLTTANILTLLALYGTGIPAVVTEHHHRSLSELGEVWGALQRITYRRAARVASVSENVNGCYAWLPADRRAVLPNILSEEFGSRGRTPRDGPRRTVIAVGRLIPAKGLDLLLRAFARIAPGFDDWDVVLLGEGPERAALEALTRELGLSDRVRFPGRVVDVESWLSAADIFVSVCRSEGFNCATVEAMAQGLPVLASETPGGTREIVRDGVNGLVVPSENVGRLAEAMSRLMADEALRHRLGACATAVGDHFRPATVVPAWEALFTEVVAPRFHAL